MLTRWPPFNIITCTKSMVVIPTHSSNIVIEVVAVCVLDKAAPARSLRRGALEARIVLLLRHVSQERRTKGNQSSFSPSQIKLCCVYSRLKGRESFES